MAKISDYVKNRAEAEGTLQDAVNLVAADAESAEDVDALINYANQVTGADDKTLSDAVQTLINGRNNHDLLHPRDPK